jgi:hypothetical protein
MLKLAGGRPDATVMGSPCAKGSIVVGAVASLRRLRSSGRVTDDQLEARLSRAALELLAQKIDIGRWYPISAFAELVEFEWEMVAARDPDYAREGGAKGAQRLFQSGRYQQLDFAQRTGRAESRDALVRRSKLITTITATLYNFLEVSVGIDPERPNELSIEYANAAEFTEPLRYTTEGFMNAINEAQGSSRRWTSERVAPDRVVFRLAIPARLS